MSSMSTSSRPTHGLPVSAIDTRGPDENAQSAVSFSGWPLTPQSTNESRRSSLAYSPFSDGCHSGPSSISELSQPATPVHSMQHQVNFIPWTTGVDMPTSVPLGLPDNCSSPVQHPMFSSAYPPSMCTVAGAADAHFPSSAAQTHDSDALEIHSGGASPAKSTWDHLHQSATSLDAHEGLRTSLFQTSQELSHEAIVTYDHLAVSMPAALEGSVFPHHDATCTSAAFHQTAQVVVPSQIGPREDFPVDTYSPYGNHDVNSGLSHSFDATSSGYSGWTSMEAPSPMETYFGRSDDNDVAVEKDIPITPTRSSLTYQSRRFMSSSSSYGQHGNRRRASKRSRKTRMEGSAWAELEVAGTTVRCEGARFGVDGVNECGQLNVVPAETQRRKQHRCDAALANGKVCNAGFERSEHLKRHMASHSDDRKYPCPLCPKAIARPDNATDHFKTHLRKPVKGKRNKPHNWAELEPLLFQKFEEKTARKLATNLRKWLCTENVKDDGKEIPGFPLMQWHRMEEVGHRMH